MNILQDFESNISKCCCKVKIASRNVIIAIIPIIQLPIFKINTFTITVTNEWIKSLHILIDRY